MGDVTERSPGFFRPPPRWARKIDFKSLRRTRHANPVWAFNRPRHWRQGKSWLYYGAMAGSCGLALAAAELFPKVVFAEALAVYTLSLGVLQMLLGYLGLRTFDFLAQRRWMLQDLWVTPLTPDEIAYGSLRAGVWFTFLLMLPLCLVDIVSIGSRHAVTAPIYAAFVLTFRFLLQCTVVEVAANVLSRMEATPLPLLWGVVLRIVWRMVSHWAVFFGAAFLIMSGPALRYIPLLHLLAPLMPWLSIPVLGVYGYFLGTAAIENAYRITADNYGAVVAGERIPHRT